LGTRSARARLRIHDFVCGKCHLSQNPTNSRLSPASAARPHADRNWLAVSCACSISRQA